ncbi:MAG: right-handed parallel beta-helix repeat-containing protein [Planctomycetota bacterium]
MSGESRITVNGKSPMGTNRLQLVIILLCICRPCFSKTYCVATDGNDSNPGTQRQPFRTVRKAVATVHAGDTIYIRGGTYNLSDTIVLNKTGSKSARIKLWAYKDELPILDASNASDGIEINGGFWHLKGLAVRKAGDKGIHINGSHNIIELTLTYENTDGGLKIDTGAADNLVLNCDSYTNYDRPGGADADGFAAKHGLGKGNAFKGCRAWYDSDDGFDLMEAGNAVILEDCWAWGNGRNIWRDPEFEGNGVGYKLGEAGGEHVVVHCLAWKNGTSGFNIEENTSVVTLYNNTAWNNPRNYLFDDNHPHKLRNNISCDGRVVMDAGIDHSSNSWNGRFLVNAEDFLSLDDSCMNAARGPDGGLPQSDFLRLAPGSDLIDAGIDVGLRFNGSAPDLGAFESTGTSTNVSRDGTVNRKLSE